MSKNYSHEIVDAIIACMNEEDWHINDFDRESGIISLRFNVKCSLGHVRIIFDVQEDKFITFGCMDMNVAEGHRNEAAEYITRANYGLKLGNFEMDMSDGEVRYKCAMCCDGITPSKEMIIHSVVVPITMFNRYGDDLLKVMLGVSSPEEAIRHAEADLR